MATTTPLDSSLLPESGDKDSNQQALSATLQGILSSTAQATHANHGVQFTRSERGEVAAFYEEQIGGWQIADFLKNMTPGDIHLLEDIKNEIIPRLSDKVGKHLVGVLNEKANQIMLESWRKTAGTLIEQLKNAVSIQDVSAIYNEMRNHLASRVNIPVPTEREEVEFAKLIRSTELRRDTLQKQLDDELSVRFEQGLDILAFKLEQILFSSQISTLYNESVYTALVQLMENMSPDKREKNQKSLEVEISKRLSTLLNSENAQSEALKKEQKGYMRSAQDILVKIEDAVRLQTTLTAIEQLESGGLLTQFENILLKFTSDADRHDLDWKLTQIFEKKKTELKIGTVHGGLVDIGNNVKLKVFVPEPPKQLRWEVKTKPPKDGMIEIYFEARELGKSHEDGEVLGHINPHGGVDNGQKSLQVYDPNYPLRVNEADFREMVKYIRRGKDDLYKRLGALDEYDANPASSSYKTREEAQKVTEHARQYGYLTRILAKLPKENKLARKRVPTLNAGAVIGPTAREFIKKISEFSAIQLSSHGEGTGIIIGESDAGTGKNYKLEIFAALTNREIFEMSGNKTATRSDVLFTHEIGPDGTYRASTELIKGMQTPGAIVCIDEINAYPAEVAKLLNPLLTGARYINDPIRGKIYCDPSVIICGFMNPQNYLGTNSLAQELRSRARIIYDSYPIKELPDGQGLNWEEGYIMARHAKKFGLSMIDQDTFIKQWLQINVNRQVQDSDFGGINEAKNEIVLFRKYVRFAAKMRDLYRLTLEGKEGKGETFHYAIGLRETIQIVYEFERINIPNSNEKEDFKMAVYDVIAPKLSMKGIEVEEEKQLLLDSINKFFS